MPREGFPAQGNSQVVLKQKKKRGNKYSDFILLPLFHLLIAPEISQNQQEAKGKEILLMKSIKVSLPEVPPTEQGYEGGCNLNLREQKEDIQHIR